MQLLAAPDKFRGTATADAAARALCDGAARAGWSARERPLADGGEGTLGAFGGPNRSTTVAGPLGEPVEASWRLEGKLAVIEMALASGLALVGGAAGNDPVSATTTGTGELISAAIAAGARHVIVGAGGSATTDGGLGALEALGFEPFAARGVEVEVACDVETHFIDAARVFGPQKGADAATVELLGSRLSDVAARYHERFGVDVTGLDHSGAAGGLAGGLAALGARLRPGFDLIADAVGLDGDLLAAALVVTGEGRVDATSFVGKVVGGVIGRARRRGIETLVVAGSVAPGVVVPTRVISLVERFGERRAMQETTECLAEALASSLERPASG